MPNPTQQVFIASYAKDFPWLLHCLSSLKLFAHGFLPPVVAVPERDIEFAKRIALQSYPETSITTQKGPDGPGWAGFLKAQIAMMTADLHCPEADFIHLFGSDCFVKDTCHPGEVFEGAKPVMLYNSYAHLAVHHPQTLGWRAGTEHALGHPVEYEFMRRIPIVYPRGLYPEVRKYVANKHGKPFEHYIFDRVSHRNCSESNILGAFAWYHARDLYHWVNLDEDNAYAESALRWPSNVIQFWSHGGMDRAADCGHDYYSIEGRQNTLHQTPRKVMDEIYAWAKSERAKRGGYEINQKQP